MAAKAHCRKARERLSGVDIDDCQDPGTNCRRRARSDRKSIARPESPGRRRPGRDSGTPACGVAFSVGSTALLRSKGDARAYVYGRALPPQQDVEPAIPEADPRRRQILQAYPQRHRRIVPRPVASARPREPAGLDPSLTPQACWKEPPTSRRRRASPINSRRATAAWSRPRPRRRRRLRRRRHYAGPQSAICSPRRSPEAANGHRRCATSNAPQRCPLLPSRRRAILNATIPVARG